MGLLLAREPTHTDGGNGVARCLAWLHGIGIGTTSPGLACAILVLASPAQAQTATLVDRKVVSPASVPLTWVMGLVVDSADRVFVLDWGGKQIFVLSGRGVVEATLGRPGPGPGEFVTPINLGWHGDSLWVVDASLRRLSWFSSRGTHLGTASIREELPQDLVPMASPLANGVLGDGSLLVNFSTGSLSTVDSIPLLAWRAQGQFDTLFVYDRPPSSRMTSPGGRMTRVPAPFATNLLWEVSATGEWYVLVRRPRSREIQQRAEVTVVTFGDGRGRTQKRWTFETPAIAIPREVRDSVLDLHALNTGVSRAVISRTVAIPPTFPSVTAVVATSDRTVWLRTEGDREVAQWTVFTMSGQMLYRVRVPAGFQVMEVKGSTVYGIATDDDGVPQVVSYGIRR